MKNLQRLLWTPIHLAYSATVLALWMILRRRRSLVFNHFRDIDGSGLDRQMGPLADALATREDLVEVTRVPLDSSLFTNYRYKHRAFISQATILWPASLLGFGDLSRSDRLRVLAARILLRLLRPRVLYLIDESGSGQPLVRAARQCGIPTVGIQHGDFVNNPQYEADGRAPDTTAADALCVWSPWFRDRLLANSSIYPAKAIAITGRLRYPPPPVREFPTGPCRVLVIGEADPSFADAVAPYLTALHEAAIETEFLPHPATVDRRIAPRGDAIAAIQQADVVLGCESSALLEASFWHRPAIVCGEDPSGLGSAGAAVTCDSPATLAIVCHDLASAPRPGPQTRTAHATVWGAAPADPIAAILATGERLGSRSTAPRAEIRC